MIHKSLAQIAAMIPGAAVDEASSKLMITGVSRDTRELQVGRLYVPIIGERFDGHSYVAEAASKGAAAAFWQRDHGAAPTGVPVVLVDDSLVALQQLASAYRAQLPIKVIGITGSNGKTSTKDMVAAIAGEQFNTLKTKGNYNNEIGLPLTLLELDDHMEIAVLEMGMSGYGEIELLSRIAKPDIAIITNIGEAHMLQLGSREGIAKAKLEIIAGLQPGGVLIYDGDEPLLSQRVEELMKQRNIRCIRFGHSERNEYYPCDIRISAECTEFSAVRAADGSRLIDLRIPLLGRHNAVNALSAIAAGEIIGLTEKSIHSGLARMTPTGMRIETVHASNGAVLLNDTYNASPASMTAALRLLEELQVAGRKIVVLGDMLDLGPESEHYHREIGRSLSPEHFHAVFTHGELAAYIAMECEERFPPGTIEAYTDKQALISRLRGWIKPQDTLLFKASRGQQLEEIVEALM